MSGWARLAALSRVEEAYLFETGLADLRALRGWTQLTSLALLGRHLKSLDGIGALRALESCSLATLGIVDLEPLRGLEKLRSLSLSSLDIDHIGPLADLPSLQELTLYNAIGAHEWRIPSLSPLAGLRQLKKINLRWVVVSDRDLAAFKKARPEVVIEINRAAEQAVVADGPIEVHPPSPEISDWWILHDLTRLLGTGTNVEAEARLKNAIADRSAHLLARLTFDTEASAVGVSAATEEDIREVIAVISKLAS